MRSICAALLTLAGCASTAAGPAPSGAKHSTAPADAALPPAGALASGGMCAAATDPRYGYSKETPIAVGGGALGGPRRAYEYLGTLAGPNGQKISFHRNGSLPVGDDTIIDEYQITYDGQPKPILLYVDQYHWRELLAPAGLRCRRPFRLERPSKGLNGLDD
jgi:hypothetical protein